MGSREQAIIDLESDGIEKNCPLGSLLNITWQATGYQTVILGTDIFCPTLILMIDSYNI